MKRPNDEFIQTRVPTAVRKKIEKLAEKEGLSLSAYLRRLVLQAVGT